MNDFYKEEIEKLLAKNELNDWGVKEPYPEDIEMVLCMLRRYGYIIRPPLISDCKVVHIKRDCITQDDVKEKTDE